ncbi:MAG: class I tRNA ligase family protein, partial [Serratia symbiotica]|nr:class I tRNA ligase family protein [Serratia symbiotica]
ALPIWLQGYRNFCNKLWNASRFVIINSQDHHFSCIKKNKKLSLFDEWILIKLNNTIKLYRESLDNYRFDIAANILYD